MGISGLNKYFKEHASPRSIQHLSIDSLKGKTLVIDTSIYIYKFLETGELLESMYTFITQCLDNSITPLFIFDGKPLETKQALLESRDRRKTRASKKYLEIKAQYDADVDILPDNEKEYLLKLMTNYKKRCIRVSNNHVLKIKEMMDSMGVYYCDAPNESDVVCAYYVEKGYAWACVSDDMDMFAYNCPRVIREWSIQTATYYFYDFESIKKDIHLPNKYTQVILLLLGNDYIRKKERLTMMTIIKWFQLFQHDPGHFIYNKQRDFLKWLSEKDFISPKLETSIKSIQSHYEVPEYMILKKLFPFSKKTSIDFSKLDKLLSPYGYIFIP